MNVGAIVRLVVEVLLALGVIGLLPRLFAWLGALANQQKVLAKTVLDDLVLKLVEEVVVGVTGPMAEAYKAANADGKLTDEEKAELLGQAKALVIGVLAEKGIDAIGAVGHEAMELAIAYAVEKAKALLGIGEAPEPEPEPEPGPVVT